jgi:hypothetical protein
LFVVEIFDADGDPAEFAVSDPVVALDLVQRAQRAGLHWQVLERARGRYLPFEDIRHRAESLAAVDQPASEQMRQADREHERARRAALN